MFRLPSRARKVIILKTIKKHKTIAKERCILIHNDFHEDFDAIKFSRRFEVKEYKMTIVTTVRNALRNILDNINETKSELILLHVGKKDFSIGQED